jgi:hypothetical protein
MMPDNTSAFHLLLTSDPALFSIVGLSLALSLSTQAELNDGIPEGIQAGVLNRELAPHRTFGFGTCSAGRTGRRTPPESAARQRRPTTQANLTHGN